MIYISIMLKINNILIRQAKPNTGDETMKLMTWEEVEEVFGVTEEECMELVEEYRAGGIGDFLQSVEFYPNLGGHNDEEFISEFRKAFPNGKIMKSFEDNYLVLDTEEKQLWGFTMVNAQ
jgi:hypothetical protein